MRRPELVPTRTVSAPAGIRHAYYPWVEVSALVQVSVPRWGVAETAWAHWAVAVNEGKADLERVVRFDPARRAATPGPPPPEARAGKPDPTEAEEVRVGEFLAAWWNPVLHFHSRLRLASLLDEPLETFRRRCLALIAPALREVGPTHRGREASSLTADIESRVLGGDEFHVLLWRVGVGWYPSGIEPAAGPRDPMMSDSQVQKR